MPKRSRNRAIPDSDPRHTAAPDPIIGLEPAPAHTEPPPSSNGSPPARRIETWAIDRLQDHPWQAVLYRKLDGPEFEDLVANLERNGLDHPIWVTPDGVVIDGHRRVQAARRLGWTEITVWVRDDMDGDQAAIDRAHIEANRDRRQLRAIDRVRLERRLVEIEKGRRWAAFAKSEKEEFIDFLGQKYGCSRRHARRLINILGTPMPIQAAVSPDRVPLVKADQVSRLGWTKQLKFAEEIEAGGDPAEIVARYLPVRKRRVKADVAYGRVVTELERGLDDLEGREAEIERRWRKVEEDLEVFERFERFRKNVVPMLERRLEERRHSFGELGTERGFGEVTNGFDPAVA